jgi:dTDP-4-amino-4,6-dideoxygalactose transaminase
MGLVTTNNREYARTIRSPRNWGEEHRYYPVLKGYNYRLSGLQAAILRVKLSRLEQSTEARRKLAGEYDRLLEDSGVLLPRCHSKCPPRVLPVHHPSLRPRSIAAGTGRCRHQNRCLHYPVPIHLMPAYTDERYKAGDFPIAEACARLVLSLPLYPHMTSGQAHQVVEEVHRLRRKTGQETLLQRR